MTLQLRLRTKLEEERMRKVCASAKSSFSRQCERFWPAYILFLLLSHSLILYFINKESPSIPCVSAFLTDSLLLMFFLTCASSPEDLRYLSKNLQDSKLLTNNQTDLNTKFTIAFSISTSGEQHQIREWRVSALSAVGMRGNFCGCLHMLYILSYLCF